MDELLLMFETYVNMTEEERTTIALEASNAILDHFENIFEGEELFDAYLQMYSIFCCVNNDIAYEQYELFKNITGAQVQYEEFYPALTNCVENVNVEEFFAFAYEQGEEFVGALCILAICIFACDGKIDEIELKLINLYFLEQN